jgi:hypothetical protein
MKKTAVYGVGAGVNGRDAAMQATQRALDQLGATKPVLALVFVSQEFQAGEVLSGLTSLLGDIPLWGFTTTTPLCSDGDLPRSVLVALITGSDLKAEVQWFPNYAQDSPAAARQFIANLKQEVFLPQEILLVADGINGSLLPVCAALAELQVNIVGCMAAGEPSLGKTYGIGKNQAGPGALSAVILGGRFRLGVGLGHGWQDLGIYFRATRTRDVWLQTLDGVPSAEAFSRYFGYTAREWAFPPLTDIARLYPLGVEPPRPDSEAKRATGPFRSTAALTPLNLGTNALSGSTQPPATPGTGSISGGQLVPGNLGTAALIGARPIPTQPPIMPVGTGPLSSSPPPVSSSPFVEMNPANLLLRSILRVEIDGSLRMSAPVPEGAVVHLMTGDPDACLTAARDAAEQALFALGSARPLLAIAFIDAAWQTLFATRPSQVTDVLKAALSGLPLVGAYTFGQLVRPRLDEPPVLHNQNIAVVVFGEATE